MPKFTVDRLSKAIGWRSKYNDPASLATFFFPTLHFRRLLSKNAITILPEGIFVDQRKLVTL